LQPAQILAGLAGLAFLVFGFVGFSRTGVANFTGQHDEMLLGFMINPAHNAVHVMFGVLGLLMALTSTTARTYGLLLLVGYGAVFVWGLMITGVVSSNPVSALGNPLSLNAADNWLHLGLAVFGLIVTMAPARRRIVLDEPDETVDTIGDRPSDRYEVTEHTPAYTDTTAPVTDRHGDPVTEPTPVPARRGLFGRRDTTTDTRDERRVDTRDDNRVDTRDDNRDHTVVTDRPVTEDNTDGGHHRNWFRRNKTTDEAVTGPR
jgi:hypothetical protein